MEELLQAFYTILQVPVGLPLRREMEHEIQLIPYSPLPNSDLYRPSVLESDEVKRQIQELLDQGLARPSVSPTGSPIVLVPKKDGTSQMFIRL